MRDTDSVMDVQQASTGSRLCKQQKLGCSHAARAATSTTGTAMAAVWPELRPPEVLLWLAGVTDASVEVATMVAAVPADGKYVVKGCTRKLLWTWMESKLRRVSTQS